MSGRGVRLLLPWLGLGLVAIGVVALRYGLIERGEMARWCHGVGSPVWCTWRQWIVLGFLSYAYGYIALAMTGLALWWRRPTTAWLATAAGMLAVGLYCVDAGAFALLLGGLLLLRRQAAATAPGQQHRRGEREVQAQP